jgi:hypothetical protein
VAALPSGDVRTTVATWLRALPSHAELALVCEAVAKRYAPARRALAVVRSSRRVLAWTLSRLSTGEVRVLRGLTPVAGRLAGPAVDALRELGEPDAADAAQWRAARQSDWARPAPRKRGKSGVSHVVAAQSRLSAEYVRRG